MVDQVEQVLALVSSELPADDDQPEIGGWLQRMCRAATRDLPATGVGVSLLSHGGGMMRAAASSRSTLLVEELQFTLGEGPCLLAYSSREPVLVPDLARSAETTWPGYAHAAYEHGVRAVFAFPLLVGGARLGALDVYRQQVGELTATAHDRAATFAAVATERLLGAGSSDEDVDALLDHASGTRFEVYQAQGMVMIQLSVGADEALARLRAYAFLHSRRLVHVAQDVIGRRLFMERDD